MAAKAIHSSDSKSLWNFSLAPGWTREETEVLRYALMKHGIGNWQTIIEERVLPGKTNAQLVCQTQRLLGQQSLIEFNKLKIDPKRVFERNAAKTGPEIARKNGILINSGDKLTAEIIAAKIKENKELYELTEEEVAKIAIPALREAQTTLLVVDSAVKTTASIKQTKLRRLSAMYERLAELKERLASLELGVVFPEEPSSAGTPAGRRPRSSGDTATRGGKGGKKSTKDASKRKPKSTRVSFEEADSDEDFANPPEPKTTSRGRVVKRPLPVYGSAGSCRKKPQFVSAGTTEDDDFALAMQLSMQD